MLLTNTNETKLGEYKMSRNTGIKLTNGAYVLADDNDFVLAYRSEADDYVTWEILDNDINKTHDGSYYSKIEDAIDCYLNRSGKKHFGYSIKDNINTETIMFGVTSILTNILKQYLHTNEGRLEALYENKD